MRATTSLTLSEFDELAGRFGVAWAEARAAKTAAGAARLRRPGGGRKGCLVSWLAVRDWEGLAWVETRYEDLVADLEKEGRRVTAFLRLEWREEQKCFYDQSRYLYSPTYQDVTRPVHARSVGRWRVYEKHLAPILTSLEPYVRAFGYGN